MGVIPAIQTVTNAERQKLVPMDHMQVTLQLWLIYINADCDTPWSKNMQQGMTFDGRLRVINPFRVAD